MFWRSINLRKWVMRYLNYYLKPECYIAEISTLTASRTPEGGWAVYVKIIYPKSLDGLNWTCGKIYLDNKGHILHNCIYSWDKICSEKSIIDEAQKIVENS